MENSLLLLQLKEHSHKIGNSKLPVIGERRTWRLEGTVGVINGPATVGGIIETNSIPFSFANLKASSSVDSFDRTYT